MSLWLCIEEEEDRTLPDSGDGHNRGRSRAVMIPGLESAPEYDWSMILKFVRSDSGSGSFQVDPLESAPVLESAPLVHCWSFLNQAEPVISYFDVPNGSIYSNLINIG